MLTTATPVRWSREYGRTLVLAGGLLILGGCSKNSTDEFETYDQLKKSSVASKPTEGLPSASDTVTPGPVKPDTLKTVPRPGAAMSTGGRLSATGPAGSQANESGTARGSVYQASVTTAGQRIPSAVTSSAGSQRKPQVLVAVREFKREGKEGAWRVSYDDLDLLKVLNMDPVTPDAPAMMPAWLKQLDGQRIRIRGFMYPTFQQTGIHAFALARDNQICCFGRNPKIYDVFDVALRRGITTNYIPNRPFDVVGVFHIRPEADEGKLDRLYEMDDATVVTK